MPYKDPNKRRERERQRYKLNREKVLAYMHAHPRDPEKKRKYQRAHYLKNRERLLAAAKQYRKAHPEKRKAEAARYRRRHPEVVRAKAKRYAAKHADHIKRYVKEHRKEFAARTRRRRARMAEVLCTLTASQWEAILALHENRCAYCGRYDVPMTQDHVVPISRGGSHSAENVVPACKSCNSGKGARTPEEWRIN